MRRTWRRLYAWLFVRRPPPTSPPPVRAPKPSRRRESPLERHVRQRGYWFPEDDWR